MHEWMGIRTSRRQFLSVAGGGLGLLAIAAMQSSALPTGKVAPPKHPLAPKPPHFEPKAKRVLWLFMHGGPSHVDLFDPKSDLQKYAGQPLPDSFGDVMTRRKVAKNPLLAPVKPFKKYGNSGVEVSDFLPHIAQHADKLCVIRSMHGDSVNHPQSVYQMNTGNILMGHPSVGSWVTYGLGTENQDMPSFIVMTDKGGGIKGGPPAWGSGYLPATDQGTTMRTGEPPILDLAPQPGISRSRQKQTFDLLQMMNARHRDLRGGDDEFSARIEAYELAFRMQAAAPALVDLSQETAATKKLYGVDHPKTRDFGVRCLLARRMLESGVRFVQLYSGDTNGWDAHNNVLTNHTEYTEKTDKPIAGLLTDLSQRGLLEDTLVIWGGEFGRMPMSEQGKGRDHNPWGFCYWLSGAGVKGGHVHGATDAVGLRAAVNKVHISNLHATILWSLGLDPERLTYFHNGLEEKLTGVEGARVMKELFA
jgi:hypothetical protein